MSIAGIEVAEKFVVGGVMEHMAYISNLNPRFKLLWVEKKNMRSAKYNSKLNQT